MGNLLNALLSLNRLESGVIQPEISEFPLSELLDRMENEFRVQAEEKGLNLHVAPCSMTIRSDPNLLDRILQNFIANAIRYTDAGKVLIGCRRRGDHVRIEIWDTDVGIPDQELESIFEDSLQLDNPGREKHKGLGLGLSIVKHLATILSHDLEVRSVLGRGSVFSIEVPAVNQDRYSPARVDEDKPAAAPELSSVTVLLVEDESGVLDATSLLLDTLGIRTVAASNGQEALERLKGVPGSPDLIIADYRLPEGETGIDVIGVVRKAMHKNIPAIVITGDTSPEVTEELGESGCRVLYKPIDDRELIKMIAELVTR